MSKQTAISNVNKKYLEDRENGYNREHYSTVDNVNRLLEEYKQEQREEEERRQLRQYSQYQAERNAELADWIKGISPLELEDQAQQARIDASKGIYTSDSGTQHRGSGSEIRLKIPTVTETGTSSGKKRAEDTIGRPTAPTRKLTPDVEAQRLRVANGEAPSNALTPRAQYMQTYTAQRENEAKKAGENAESGWKSVGQTAGGMAANFISGVGQPLVNIARLTEVPEDILYKVTGNEKFNLDREPYLRNSEALKASDDFAATARDLREKVGPLGQQLIDSAGAAGNMLASFALFGGAASAAGNPVEATAKLANAGGKIGSALGRIGAKIGIEILSNPGNFGISLGSAVGSYSDAYANGAGFGQALANGIMKGLTEYYSNKLFSGTPFEDSADKGYVTQLIERVADKLGGSKVLQAINASTGGKVMNWVLDKAGEGMEEVVTGVADPLIDRITYDKTRDLATADELSDEFIGGVLLSLLMSGGEAMITGLQSQVKMTEREAEVRLIRMGIDPKTAKAYSKDIAEAVTSMLQNEQIRNKDFTEKSAGDPEIAARAAESNDESLKRYAEVYNREEAARDLRRGANPAEADESAFLTDSEAKNYFYIWNKQGARAANAFYEQYLEPVIEQRRTIATQEYIQKAMREWQAETILRRNAAPEAEAPAAQAVQEQQAPPAPRANAENVQLDRETAQNMAPAENKSQQEVQLSQENENRQGPPVPRAAQEAQGTEEWIATEPAAPRNDGDAKAKRAAQQALATQRKRALANNSPQSLQEMGFQTAGEGTTHVFAENQWDGEMQALAEGLRAEGIEPTYFTGNAMNAEGKKVATLLEGNRLAIQADNRSKNIQTLAEQALGHSIAEATSPALRVTSPAGEAKTGERTATEPALPRNEGKLKVRQQEDARSTAVRSSGESSGASKEDIDTAVRLAKVLNRDIRFYNEPAQNGTRTNGYTENGVIYINAGVKAKPVVWVVAHELTHNTENAKAYQGLLKLAKQYYGDQWEKMRDSRVKEAKQVADARNDKGFLLDPEEAERELAADYFAQRLLTNEDAIREVVKYDAPTARHILSYLKNLLAKMKGDGHE